MTSLLPGPLATGRASSGARHRSPLVPVALLGGIAAAGATLARAVGPSRGATGPVAYGDVLGTSGAKVTGAIGSALALS